MRTYDHVTCNAGKKTVSGLIWSGLNATLATTLTAAVFFITSHILAPEDFGAVAFAASIVALSSTMVPLAFYEALVQRSDVSNAHLDTVFWMNLGAAAIIWLALWVGSDLLAELLQVDALSVILPILGIRVLFDATGSVPMALILRKMSFKKIALRTTIANGIAAVICLLLALKGHAFWALVLSQLIGAVIQALFSLWVCGWLPGVHVSLSAFMDLRRFGLFTMGRKFFDAARLDQVLMGSLLGAPALGLYFFAFRLNEMIQQLTTVAVSQVFSVTFSGLQNDRERLRAMYFRGCFGAALLSFPIFVGLILVAPEAVPVFFGEQWRGGVFAVQMLAGLSLMASIGSMQAALIQAVGQAGWWFTYRAFVQIVGFVVIMAAVPFGLNAVVMGLLLRTLLLWPISIWRVLRILDTDLNGYVRVLCGPVISVAAMTGTVLLGKTALSSWPSGPLVIALIVLGSVTYAATIFVLSREHIAPVWQMIRNSRKGQAV